RTGTTLVDRIISSHPEVHSAGELQNFGMAVKRASGSRTPPMLDLDTLQRTRDLDWKRVGQLYVESTRPSTAHRPRFIDKLPHNFLHAGFIAAALPNAKMICLRRNPMDTCLSNFRQLFALNSAYCNYSFDLLDTGRYYVMFDRLMAFWRERMPGRILEVDYETVVDQQEASTRALLEFCGLGWNEACLRFEQNEAPVSTASAVQVRSPMYRSALNRWKRYEPELTELKVLLTDAGIDIGD
ncbi:MAG TPA: sulfotransferase, partial [Luteimonas sp.]|nr:sulfotransferase [Luteimonas sp.]